MRATAGRIAVFPSVVNRVRLPPRAPTVNRLVWTEVIADVDRDEQGVLVLALHLAAHLDPLLHRPHDLGHDRLRSLAAPLAFDALLPAPSVDVVDVELAGFVTPAPAAEEHRDERGVAPACGGLIARAVDEGSAIVIRKEGVGTFKQFTAGSGTAYVITGGSAATIQSGQPRIRGSRCVVSCRRSSSWTVRKRLSLS